jgi:hypothetical protein
LANVFHQHTLQPKTNVLDSQIKWQDHAHRNAHPKGFTCKRKRKKGEEVKLYAKHGKRIFFVINLVGTPFQQKE